MKERPILFSAPMVRALLAGTKTQTRRVMSRQKRYDFTDYTLFGQRGHPDDEAARRGGWAQPWVAVEHAPDWPDGKEDRCPCPYVSQRGDRLWVRETWRYCCSKLADGESPEEATVQYKADDAQATILLKGGERTPQARARREGESRDDYEEFLTRWWARSIPGIHMPRWANRILLEVTGVRVERLQDISEADAVAEGIRISSEARRSDTCYGIYEAQMPDGKTHFNDSAYDLYRQLWEQINGAGAWGANPWVWVVEFRRVLGKAGAPE